MSNLSRQEGLTPEVESEIDDMFGYHAWNDAKTAKGALVRAALAEAFKTIVAHVPACPDRSEAMRKIRSARMDCNSAITHDGKY